MTAAGIGPLNARVLYIDKEGRERLAKLAEEAARAGQAVTMETAWEASQWWYKVTVAAPRPLPASEKWMG